MTFFQSFKAAAEGIKIVWTEERNFRVQSVIGLCVMVLMFVLPLRMWERIVIIMCVVSVLVVEIANSVIERFVDMVMPRLHNYARVIKDLAAAAVLLVSIAAFLIGCFILIPYVRACVVQYAHEIIS